MNIKSFRNISHPSLGENLRRAREKMGLSQQEVAKKLCLKISIIHDIENDYINPNFKKIFLHGYIHSYARLVFLSEKMC